MNSENFFTEHIWYLVLREVLARMNPLSQNLIDMSEVISHVCQPQEDLLIEIYLVFVNFSYITLTSASITCGTSFMMGNTNQNSSEYHCGATVEMFSQSIKHHIMTI